MAARATKHGVELSIDSGCSLENFALSRALRDISLVSEVEFLEVVAGCDGCDTRDVCRQENDTKDKHTISYDTLYKLALEMAEAIKLRHEPDPDKKLDDIELWNKAYKTAIDLTVR